MDRSTELPAIVTYEAVLVPKDKPIREQKWAILRKVYYGNSDTTPHERILSARFNSPKSFMSAIKFLISDRIQGGAYEYKEHHGVHICTKHLAHSEVDKRLIIKNPGGLK